MDALYILEYHHMELSWKILGQNQDFERKTGKAGGF
jgi:hypothetical protein